MNRILYLGFHGQGAKDTHKHESEDSSVKVI